MIKRFYIREAVYDKCSEVVDPFPMFSNLPRLIQYKYDLTGWTQRCVCAIMCLELRTLPGIPV